MHPVPPYGVAIQEAIRSGDTARMQQVAQEAEKHLKEVREALEQLHQHLGQRNS
ncbi:MAG TPA: DUF1843 domain-containing protein [Longimicrobium sp.]|nr:DUF1843 domain-containing protein [Longimicrobium sp.]